MLCVLQFWQNVNDRINYYCNLFAYTCENDGIYDSGDLIHVFCMQWTLVPIIQSRANKEVEKYNKHYVRPNLVYGTRGGVPNRMKVEFARPVPLVRRIPAELTLECVLELAHEELGDTLKTDPVNPLYYDPIAGHLGDLRNVMMDTFRANLGLDEEAQWEDMIVGEGRTEGRIRAVFMQHKHMTLAIRNAQEAGVGAAAFVGAAPEEDWRPYFEDCWNGP